MRTLYLDVYFLINFTTDTLAVYYALKLCGIKTSVARICAAGVLGALAACLSLLFDLKFMFFAPILLISVWLAVLILAKKEPWYRRLRLLAAILLFETLIGGVVSWLYSVLDKLILPFINESEGGAENKKMLIASVLILFGIGMVKLFLLIFSGAQKNCRAPVSIALFGETVKVDGFFDSGNMLTDPFGARAVIIVKYKSVERLLKNHGGEEAFTCPDDEIKRRMRVIPIKNVGAQSLLYGILPDRVTVFQRAQAVTVDAVIAIDFTSGDFGGFDAIIPASLK